MPVRASGPLWRRITLFLFIAFSASYVWYSRREYTHGGSTMGLFYGIAGTLLILLLAYFGIRKRSYRSTFGTLEQWLQSHIYLGVLVLVVLLFHSGGRFNDSVAVITLILVAIVVFSGIFGAILYASVPRILTEVESDLTAEEMSEQINQMAKSMARIASGKSPSFQRIYEEMIRESRPGFVAGWRLLFSGKRNKKSAPGEWSKLVGLVGPDEQEELKQMLVASRQRRELLLRLIYQQKYKNILEAWLYIHVPFTIALLLFAVVHVVAVFYYRKIG